MDKKRSTFRIVFLIIKILTLLSGGVFLFLKKKNIATWFKRQNMVIAGVYGVLLSILALMYKIIMQLVWLLQQAGPR